MLWKKFPYPNSSFLYGPSDLKKVWTRLHADDAESFPSDSRLVEAWIAFHYGEFDKAVDLGLAIGIEGYSVANKALFIYANYLENKEEKRLEFYGEISSRCDVQQSLFPDNPAAFFWQAQALSRYWQSKLIARTLIDSAESKIYDCLKKTIALAPTHATAYAALGAYHAEVISKLCPSVGGISEMPYGVTKEEALGLFKKALQFDSQSAQNRIDYANSLIMLHGKDRMNEAIALYEEAAAIAPKDAAERLHVQLAMDEIQDE